MTNPRAVIFDVDGTLADVRHRRHFLTGRPKNHAAFHDAMVDDTVREPVAELARALARTYPVLLVSGRPERYRRVTGCWLDDNFIPYRALYLRADDDRRDDVLVKREMLAAIRLTYDPLLVVDDRAKLVAMWREEGLVCLQCDVGLF